MLRMTSALVPYLLLPFIIVPILLLNGYAEARRRFRSETGRNADH